MQPLLLREQPLEPRQRRLKLAVEQKQRLMEEVLDRLSARLQAVALQ